MNHRALLTLLCVALGSSLGVSHCEAGDQRAFSEQACWIAIGPGDPTPPDPAKVVTVTHDSSNLGDATRVIVDVDACGATLVRIHDGAAEQFGPKRLEPGIAEGLHRSLAEAGAGNAKPVRTDPFLCPVISHSSFTRVVFFEPSLLPDKSWANSFSFGSCSWSDQTTAINQVIWTFVEEQFAESY